MNHVQLNDLPLFKDLSPEETTRFIEKTRSMIKKYSIGTRILNVYDQNRNETGQIYIDKAIEYNKEAINLYKHSGQLRMMLASYYWNNDKKDEAVNVMQEALKYDRFNPKFEEYLFELKNS